MLLLHEYESDGLKGNYFTSVRETEDLPTALEFWTAHVARDVLRLGVYFRAAALMCQIPGGTRYRHVLHDDNDDDAPPDADEPSCRLRPASYTTIFNVLHECLQRLGAPDVMKQVPGGQDYEKTELSEEWTAYLDRQAKIENGLLNVVAECLDELIVRPGMAEIDNEPCPAWYERWWARMKD